MHGIGKRNDDARGRHHARPAQVEQGPAEIDDKEGEHAEHDRCVGQAHKPSGRATAAFDRIGHIWIETVDSQIHRAGSSRKSARRMRGGTKSSYRDDAKMISAEYEKKRAHFR